MAVGESQSNTNDLPGPFFRRPLPGFPSAEWSVAEGCLTNGAKQDVAVGGTSYRGAVLPRGRSRGWGIVGTLAALAPVLFCII